MLKYFLLIGKWRRESQGCLHFIIEVDGKDIDILPPEDFIIEGTGDYLQIRKLNSEFGMALKGYFFWSSWGCEM